MKKIWFGIGIVAVLALAIVLVVTQMKKEPGEIKIGAVLPLTGDAADYGKKLKMGMDLAVEEKKGFSELKVLYEDSQAQPKQAVSAYQKLVNLDHVPIIVGLFSSAEVLSVAPLAERDKVVLLSPTASAPAITHAGEYIFRIVTSDEFDGRVMASFVRDNLNAEEAAIAYINNDYGIGVRDVFSKEFVEKGGKVLISELFSQDETDFRTQIEKLRKKKPPVVFLIGYKEMGRFLRQAWELGFGPQFVSIGLFEDPEILEVAGTAANGVYYSMPSFDLTKGEPSIEGFKNTFKKKYNVEPDILAALGYDVMRVALDTVKKGGQDASSIRKALLETKNFPGVAGEFSFDSNGDVLKPYGIKQIQNNKSKWYHEDFFKP